MDGKLRKVVLYHGLEQSEGWVKPRRKLDLKSIPPITDLDISGLDKVNYIQRQLQEIQTQRQEKKDLFDEWFKSKFIETKPSGLLQHLAPRKKHSNEK